MTGPDDTDKGSDTTKVLSQDELTQAISEAKKENGFVETPALAILIADRIDAGGAALSVTAPLVAGNTPWESTALLANLVGAEVVAELGTSITVDRTTLVKHVETILK